MIRDYKILVVTGLYPPEVGGPATHTVLMESELPAHGFRVSVLPFRKVRKYPYGIRHFLFFIYCIYFSFKNDLVFAQDTVSVGFPVALAALLTARPFVVRVPGDHAWEQARQRYEVKGSIDDFQLQKYGFRVGWLRFLRNFSVRQADAVVTPSDYFNNLVSGWIGKDSKIITIYNGVKAPNERKTQGDVERFSKTIVSIGRLVPWKGFDVLVDLIKDIPKWKLKIIGDGPESEALKLQITNYKLQDRVELLGAVSKEEVFKNLKAADVFVLNSSFESFSFQTVEALSMGLPVVATNIGSLPEIVEDGVSGFLVEPNDKKHIKEALEKIESDKDLRFELSKNAIKRAQEFSSDITGQKLANLLRSFLK